MRTETYVIKTGETSIFKGNMKETAKYWYGNIHNTTASLDHYIENESGELCSVLSDCPNEIEPMS